MKNIALLLTLLSGCSFGANSVPDDYHPDQGKPDCEPEGRRTLDVIAAGAGLLMILSGEEGAAIAGTPLLAINGIGALAGQHKVEKCNRAKSRWAAYQRSPNRGPTRIARTNDMKLAVAALRRISSAVGARATRTPLGELIIDTASNSLVCAKLDWTGAVAAETKDLWDLGVDTVTCKAGAFVVWSGNILELPTIVEETRCRPHLEAIGSAATNELHAVQMAQTPAPCRYWQASSQPQYQSRGTLF